MQETNALPLEGGEKGKWKAVYTIVDRDKDKKYWQRVGTAFINRDQSMNVKLDALPTNAMLHIRDWEPYEDRVRRQEEMAASAPLRAAGGSR